MIIGLTTTSIPTDTDLSTITVSIVSSQTTSIVDTADSPIAITALTVIGPITILLGTVFRSKRMSRKTAFLRK